MKVTVDSWALQVLERSHGAQYTQLAGVPRCINVKHKDQWNQGEDRSTYPVTKGAVQRQMWQIHTLCFEIGTSGMKKNSNQVVFFAEINEPVVVSGRTLRCTSDSTNHCGNGGTLVGAADYWWA